MNDLTKAIGLPRPRLPRLSNTELTDRMVLLESIISEILKETGYNLNFMAVPEGWKARLTKAVEELPKT